MPEPLTTRAFLVAAEEVLEFLTERLRTTVFSLAGVEGLFKKARVDLVIWYSGQLFGLPTVSSLGPNKGLDKVSSRSIIFNFMRRFLRAAHNSLGRK